MNNILLHCEHTYSGISTLITTFYASSVTTDEAYMCVCAGVFSHMFRPLPRSYVSSSNINRSISPRPKVSLQGQKNSFFLKSGDRHLVILRNTNYPSINNTEIEVMRRNSGGKRLSR